VPGLPSAGDLRSIETRADRHRFGSGGKSRQGFDPLRLSADWERMYSHPVYLAETFKEILGLALARRFGELPGK